MHDRKKFKTYTYSYGPDDGSFYRKEIIDTSDKFVDIRNIGNRQAARLIQNDRIDILLDLTGYTKDNRMEIVAMRPAPVQVSYLGFPGTSGARFFDYIITDRIITPKSSERHYSEKFVYLPDCYQASSYAFLKKARKTSRMENLLPENSVIFCSFNNSYKINEAVFKSWMRILDRVSESALWILDDNSLAQESLQKAAGKNKNRLIFAGRLPLQEHLARLGCADLALDTFPYNGGATTSNALWSGVPVLTIEGTTYTSRMSTSMLSAINLKELITKNVKEYENLAVTYGNNPQKLKAIRDKLENNKKTMPLFDTARFVRNLERAYEEMFKLYQKGKKPREIDIKEPD